MSTRVLTGFMNNMFEKTLVKAVLLERKIRNWLHEYFYFSNFKKKHFSFGFVNGKLQITYTKHEDFIASIQKKINSLDKKNRLDFVKQALAFALDGCNFIIFSPEDCENKFVQFWTGEHCLKYNFCAIKTNGLKKYFYSILGLLSEYGYINKKFITGNGKGFYEIEKSKDMINVYADFGKNTESTAEFVEEVFKKIYKIGTKKLEVKVE